MTQKFFSVFVFIFALFFSFQSLSENEKYDFVLGSADAPIEVIEYMSLTCSHCAKFHNETFPFINENYIKTSKVKFIIRDFPLDGIAYRASIISHCIADGNSQKYFGFIKYLFEQQKTWISSNDPLEGLQKISAIAGLNKDKFNSCLQKRAIGDKVLLSRKNGEEKYKISSTPTLIINGKKYSGALDKDGFRNTVDKLIK